MSKLITTSLPLSTVNHTLTLGEVMAKSGFFNDTREAAQAVVKILAGQEIGVGPVTAMTGIHIIKGKIALSANLIAAAIRRHGRYGYQVKRLDDQRCDIEFSMDAKVIGESSFTMDDARKAGLASGDNWKKYPRNMLFARAISNGAKWYCPDVFGGPVYVPDELGGTIDDDSIVIEVSPEPRGALCDRRAINDDQQFELDQLIKHKGADAAKLLSYYRVDSLTDLTPEQLSDAVGLLRKRTDVPRDLHNADAAIERTSMGDQANV